MLGLDSFRIELEQARKGISDLNLATKTRLAKQTIKNAKKGKPCKPETVYRIAKALNVDPAELIKKE